jgi:hypothetical protein
MSIDGWKHKDVWTNHQALSDNFVIEVVRHTSKAYLPNEGQNKWCMYVYVYPEHPLFKKINPTVGDTISTYDERLPDMPLHGGCTYAKIHLSDDGTKITSIQIGADYSHYNDERYSWMTAKESASDIFYDADVLYKWMQEYSGYETK